MFIQPNLVLTHKPEDKTDILPQGKNLQDVLHPQPAQRLKFSQMARLKWKDESQKIPVSVL